MLQKTTSFTEKALLYSIECPLRSDGTTIAPQPPVLQCTENMARWLIDEMAAGSKPTEGETQEFFDVQWQQTEFFQSRDAISPKDYNHQVEAGVRACSSVGDLIRQCEILQPVSPYELPIDGITIRGEYAVLSSRRRKIKTFVPYFRYERVKPRRVIPDGVTLARWRHASNRLPRREWGADHINILHCLVNHHLAVAYEPPPVRADQFLRGMVGATTHPYPRTGEHCLTCPTRNCYAAFREFPA